MKTAADERNTILAAINQIQSDLNGCVSFVEYDAAQHEGNPRVLFTPNDATGSAATVCGTAPGVDLHVTPGANNMTAQNVVIARSGAGACSTDQRGVMKVLANLLGMLSIRNLVPTY